MYKDVFFFNPLLAKHLMHALISVYNNSEKTEYYGKFQYRFASSNIMEYIFSDPNYRKQFVELNKNRAQEFSEFCNLLINDTNSLLLEGIIALQDVKIFEDLRDSPEWNTLSEEVKEAKESNFKDQSRKAKGNLQLSNMVIKLLSKVTEYV